MIELAISVVLFVISVYGIQNLLLWAWINLERFRYKAQGYTIEKQIDFIEWAIITVLSFSISGIIGATCYANL